MFASTLPQLDIYSNKDLLLHYNYSYRLTNHLCKSAVIVYHAANINLSIEEGTSVAERDVGEMFLN